MPAKPDAFLSYTRFDDQRGKISEFCSELSYAVEAVSGEPFHIFQDIDGIGIGEHWPDKLDDMLSKARFFIPIVTPKFFNSDPCRSELTRFLEQEQKVGRKDLVFPIYWIQCAKLEEPHLKANDELAHIIDERQRWDWRRHRHRPFTNHEVAEQIELLAIQIERARRNVLRLVEETEAVASSTTPRRSIPLSLALERIGRSEEPFTGEPVSRSPERTSLLWQPGEVFRDIDKPWCPEMVKIPAGTFLMGSPEDEEGRDDDEGPQHEVTISHDFALGRYPVTFEKYDHFCEATGRHKPKDWHWGRGRRPVIEVTHQDAEAYCAWLTEMTKARYRLPTEAEWEYACRARDRDAYAFGNDISQKQANFGQIVGKTTEVGAYPANGWNLHDMHGNVREWCADAPRTYKLEPVTNPKGTGPRRVLRGGSWYFEAQFLRSACRSRDAPDGRSGDVGFRCARVQGPAGQG